MRSPNKSFLLDRLKVLLAKIAINDVGILARVMELDDAREDAEDEDEEEVGEEDDEEPDNFDKDLDNSDKEPDQPEGKLDKFVSLEGKRMILQQPVSYPARSTTDA